MAAIIAALLVLLQIILALASPVGLVYLSLASGAIPVTVGPDQMITGPMGRMDISAFRLLGLWLAAMTVILFQFERAWRYIVAYKFHVLFLVFCLLSLSYAPSIEYGMRMMAKLTAPFLFLLMVMVVVKGIGQMIIIERLIIASATTIVILALAAKLMGVNPDPRFNLPGMGPATFSAHVVVVAMLALALMLNHGNWVIKIVVAVLATAVMAAFTRITIAALFVGYSVMLFFGGRGLSRYVLPAAGFIGLPALFLFSDKFRHRMFIGGDDLSADSIISNPSGALEHVRGSGRFDLWHQIITRFFDPNPAIGSGIGATQDFLYNNALGAAVAHSDYIRLLSEVGIFGFGLFLAAMAAYLFKVFRTMRAASQGRSLTRKYSLAALGGVVAYVIFLATDNGLDYVNQFGIYVFALIALSEKARELEQYEALLEKPINIVKSGAKIPYVILKKSTMVRGDAS